MNQVFNFYGESEVEIMRINYILTCEEEKCHRIKLIVDEINEAHVETEREEHNSERICANSLSIAVQWDHYGEKFIHS